MSGENAEQPADAIVAELEKVSEDAEKTEREARDASEGFPQGTPEWYKTIKRAERANQPKEQKADGERRGVIIYSSNKAREMREGNNIRENYFRQKAEEMAEKGEKFSHIEQGAIVIYSEKEKRALDTSYDLVGIFRGWDDAGRHLVGNGRITSLLKQLLNLILPGVAIAFFAIAVFDPSAFAPFENQIGPWLNNPFHEAWLFALFAVILAIVYLLRRRGSI